MSICADDAIIFCKLKNNNQLKDLSSCIIGNIIRVDWGKKSGENLATEKSLILQKMKLISI